MTSQKNLLIKPKIKCRFSPQRLRLPHPPSRPHHPESRPHRGHGSSPKPSSWSCPTVSLPALLSVPTALSALIQAGARAIPCQAVPSPCACLCVPPRSRPALPPAGDCILPLERALPCSYLCSRCTLSWSGPCPSLCAAVSPVLQGPGHIPSQPSSLVRSPKPDVISACDKSRHHFPSVWSHSPCCALHC